MAIHSTFPRGSTILIIFKDRSQIVTKYRDNKSGVIITDDGNFYKKNISSTGFYKNKGDNNESNS